MRRCPVCETELTQGLVCDNCGFDSSCDYEQNRTLCPTLPGHAEPVSVLTAKWRQPWNQIAAPAGMGKAPEKKPENRASPGYGQKELTAIICVHCGLVNPDANYVCDHCAKRLWRYTDPNAPKNVFLFGFRGFVRRYDHIKVNAAPPPDGQSAKQPLIRDTVRIQPTRDTVTSDTVKTQPALQKKPQSGSTDSLIAWGRSKEEREKADRAFDILTGKS